jgi:hypothetical protein
VRIPLTVGDICGRAVLPDSDDPANGGKPAGSPIWRLSAMAAAPRALEDGRAKIGLDAPIDLEVTG